MRKTFSIIAVVTLALAFTPGVARAETGDPLMFHEVTPCVLFDTRPSQGGTGIMAAGEARTFHVVGSTSNFAAQGGTAGGCGIPGFSGGQPQTEMVYLNLVAVDPTGGGNLRVWATDDPEPSGGVVNYQKLTPNLNNSNGVIVGVRQDSEGDDITIRANVSGVHVRGVALGYLTTAEASAWLLGGNVGTDPATDFVGTTDNTALNLRVNEQRAFRLEPTGVSPNVIGGSSANSVTGGHGATIAGGGVAGFPNQVGANFGTVGGGNNNMANGVISTVAGGGDNTTAGFASMVPGGRNNTASGEYSFAAGRRAQAVHEGAFVWADAQDADFASTGLWQFSVRAGGGVRFVVGGNTCSLDTGTGQWAGSCAPPASNAWLLGGNGGTTAGTDFLGTTDDEPLELKVNGLRALRLEPHLGSSHNLIGGSQHNLVTAGAHGATISGGGGLGFAPNKVTDDFGTIGGGRLNQSGDDAGTTSDAGFATVGGGRFNVASGSDATIGGGQENVASAGNATAGGGWFNIVSGPNSVIAGGVFNTVTGTEATIGGGNGNSAGGLGATIGGGASNATAANYATIGGGNNSDVTAIGGTVGGGQGNNAAGDFSTVGGGVSNTAGGVGQAAFVGGGNLNTATGDKSVIGGGLSNDASNSVATIGGGHDNTASALFSTVPGGEKNVAAGKWSLAAGQRAHANHQGAFVWADSQAADMESSGADQFIVRAQGNLFFQSDSSLDSQGGFINTSTGAFLSTAGVWTDNSSRTVKENFSPIDPERILDGVASLPVTTWSYRADPGVSHIGPVAEDFHATFGVGDDPRHLASLDTGGVALAAIQGLNEKFETEIASRDTQARAGGPASPSAGFWALAVGLGLLGLGLGRRWGRAAVPAA